MFLPIIRKGERLFFHENLKLGEHFWKSTYYLYIHGCLLHINYV